MALTADRTRRPVSDQVPGRSFRPASRRRTRIAAGVALGAVAIGGNLVVYSGLDRREPVLQVVHDVPAGQQLTSADVREVDVAVDATVRTVPAGDLGAIVGSYARVRLVSGSLVVVEALQPDPLVGAGSAVVAIQVPEGALPLGLRERSAIRLVVPPPSAAADRGPLVVPGLVVGLPTAPQSVTGRLSLSVEVAEDAAASVVVSDDVRVVLVEPDDELPDDDLGEG